MVAARSGGDRQGVRRKGETRQNVVVLLRIGKPEESPRERTVMKFGSGRARETIGRQMAPRKRKIRGKMAAPRIQSLNGFKLELPGGQNRSRARGLATGRRRMARRGTATTDSVDHCFKRLRSQRTRGAEQRRSGPLEPGQRRDGSGTGMRSYHGGRTGGPSSGRVLAAVAVRERGRPTFVMLRVGTAGPARRRRMRGHGGANRGHGGESPKNSTSSTPVMISCHPTRRRRLLLRQDQTGIGRTDRMEREAAAGETEVEDDRGTDFSSSKHPRAHPSHGPKGPTSGSTG